MDRNSRLTKRVNMTVKIHQIKINFSVTEQISRFVYVYVIEAKYLYLIDSGVV